MGYGYITRARDAGRLHDEVPGRARGSVRQAGRHCRPIRTTRRGTLEGSDRTYTVAADQRTLQPCRLVSSDHPPMPDIVAHGERSQRCARVRHLATCRTARDVMQNGSVSGLPREYILQQLGDFKSGQAPHGRSEQGERA